MSVMEYSKHQQQQYQPNLPPGWVETIDPNTGLNYYANAATGESSWDAPQYPMNPPPPQPLPPTHYSSQPSYPYLQQQYENNYEHSASYCSNNEHIRREQYAANDSGCLNPASYHNHYNTGSDYQLDLSMQQQHHPQQVWSTFPSHGPQMTQTSNSEQYYHHDNSTKTTMNTSCDTTFKEECDPIDNELNLLSAGQIADLCYLQQQQLQYDSHDAGSPVPPPYSVPLSIGTQQQRPRQEIARLQTRYYALKEQLKHYRI